MDFRDSNCAWCDRRRGPIEDCRSCPKFRKYYLGEDLVLDERVFCRACLHNLNSDLAVFCTTNRRLQLGSGEPFECYRFILDSKTKK